MADLEGHPEEVSHDVLLAATEAMKKRHRGPLFEFQFTGRTDNRLRRRMFRSRGRTFDGRLGMWLEYIV